MEVAPSHKNFEFMFVSKQLRVTILISEIGYRQRQPLNYGLTRVLEWNLLYLDILSVENEDIYYVYQDKNIDKYPF